MEDPFQIFEQFKEVDPVTGLTTDNYIIDDKCLCKMGITKEQLDKILAEQFIEDEDYVDLQKLELKRIDSIIEQESIPHRLRKKIYDKKKNRRKHRNR